MSKRNLENIIERVNFFRSFNEEPEMSIDTLTDKDAHSIYMHIDSGLSPEHLHCDGEISAAEARAKYNNYMGAVRELQKMGFAVPDDCWEIEA